ncbi:hypothetical protein HS088_TW14G00320 [Tripterygium wilfordii]|uniref:Uncharacterized protein n=1 Tax=Tripterygium wilfordii TaxID=458696 RepID=A0A7J7CQ44_TRIWF|nr:small RNA degrading nuclease 3-like isoform X1 [Tripterygium wilfordii]XP_038722724.1 small RNA degrading nuclease 3-like isoform X1 [Tripterygium wilfordii]XP_038722725.1 small RNA degrading nuclease 3-like isoform X1 [Tripterygium wilfordii]XP_038722726.1 small RNA degrading nuclease 3-like isoform X1 [Tripterygium wilfordii]XP_038722728.1 small RNA degrading nuclease 3-like isoform X1 [Tripterygium wilfordii]XP_038722729.1 small RNA degrading nuclease 3-like isoform X1 [Tripterygium wilf
MKLLSRSFVLILMILAVTEAVVKVCVVDHDLQKSLKKLLSHKTILMGLSLNNDLKALKLDHARVIDTSYIFRYSDGPIFRRPSVHNLCKVMNSGRKVCQLFR